jgi:tellurite resistance protein
MSELPKLEGCPSAVALAEELRESAIKIFEKNIERCLDEVDKKEFEDVIKRLKTETQASNFIDMFYNM